MSRITVKDLRVQAERYGQVLDTLGVAKDGITLEKTQSGWILTGRDSQAAPGVVGHGMEPGYIGSTAREAYATLQTIIKSMEYTLAWVVDNYERVQR